MLFMSGLIQYQMSLGSLSYRNGKYQGFLNSSNQRHGLGILIDDDLTFHVSNWHLDKMQGPTLIYLAHAKYIYGEWKNNEPHGINVYRSGDTVLLSKYVFGVPSNRCLLIFQRHSLACVLSQNNKQWQIVKSGTIINHTSLMNYIQLLQIDVPQHYLSLIKFACAFSNHHNNIKTFPCHQNYCYFGYINGLAIVFNNNNGLVTVGQHKNQDLCQFGGKFHSKKYVQEGNFGLNGERIEYKGERPIQKIYQIYQKLHKKDVNFKNESYDSRIKIFNSIQSLIINKFKHIVQDSKKTDYQKNLDLNESLNYQESEQQQLSELREKMYSPPKKIFEKISQTPTKVENPPNAQSLLKKSLKKSSTTAVLEERSLNKANEKSSEAVRSTLKGRLYSNTNKKITNEPQPLPQNNIISVVQNCDHYSNGVKWDTNHLQETSSFKQLLQKQEIQQSKNSRQPTRPQQRTPHRRQKSIDQFVRPTYQDIEQRRKRILRDLQQMNNQSPLKGKQQKKPMDSPCQEHILSQEKEQSSSFGYIPLSLSNKLNNKKSIAQGKPINQQQQNKETYKQQKSPSRRVNYNYTNLDSRILQQKNELICTEQSNVSPLKPKRTYKYMYA